MARKSAERPHFRARKLPTQSRSQSTVASIKQAALALVAKEGFTAASTTRIAERAGVSIGSLYQYFPTREAIFLALFEDTSALMTATMKRVMVRIIYQTPEKSVRQVMRQLLALHREHELVLLKMVAQVPELRLATQPVSFENMIYDAIRIALKEWAPTLSPRDVERRAFFVREIILGSIHRYLNDRPENVSDRAFIDDLTQIVLHYITMPAKK